MLLCHARCPLSGPSDRFSAGDRCWPAAPLSPCSGWPRSALQFAARSAGGRRTRIAVETGPARQRAGRPRRLRPQPQPVSAALTEVAAERAQHAQALATEIARLAVNPTSTSSRDHQPDTHHFSRGDAPTVTVRRDQFLTRVRGQRQSAWRPRLRVIGRACSAPSPPRARPLTALRWCSEDRRHDIR